MPKVEALKRNVASKDTMSEAQNTALRIRSREVEIAAAKLDARADALEHKDKTLTSMEQRLEIKKFIWRIDDRC